MNIFFIFRLFVSSVFFDGLAVTSSQFLGYFDAFHLFLDEFLQITEFPDLTSVITVYEGERLSVTVGTGSAAYTMYVVLRIMGHIKVDDQFDARDVNASAYDISSHQHIDPACLEGIHRIFSFALLQIAVH